MVCLVFGLGLDFLLFFLSCFGNYELLKFSNYASYLLREYFKHN